MKYRVFICPTGVVYIYKISRSEDNYNKTYNNNLIIRIFTDLMNCKIMLLNRSAHRVNRLSLLP